MGKSKHKISNWKQYNQALVQRGSLTVWMDVHIPVENEHLFRFKMNADSGLRVHRFRTPQCTYSDVR